MRRLWAVARTTILECLRSRIAVVFAGLVALSVGGVALGFTGDGTLKGRIQTFLDYSTTLTQLLLGLLTLFLASFVTTSDLRANTVFTVVSKPLSRKAYVVGRWLGVVLLNALLLAIALGAIYGLAQYLRRLPTDVERKKRLGELPADEIDLDRLAVRHEVLAARVRVKPQPFDVDDAVKQRMDLLLTERGKDNFIRDQVRAQLRKEAERKSASGADETEVESRAADPAVRKRVLALAAEEVRKQLVDRRQLVQPGRRLQLIFKAVPVPTGKGQQVLQFRYRLHPIRRPDSGLLRSLWVAYNPKSGDLRRALRDDPVDTTSSLEMPAELVTADNELTVLYVNLSPPRADGPVAVKVIPDELSLLCPAGGFEANLARAGALILFRLMFLAGAGVLFGVFLSFPVACLTCLVIFFLGCMGNFVQDATGLPLFTDPGLLDYLTYGMARFAFLLLPNLPVASSPADALRDGTVISWQVLGAEVATGTGLRTLATLVVGSLVFWRRELARVQV